MASCQAFIISSALACVVFVQAPLVPPSRFPKAPAAFGAFEARSMAGGIWGPAIRAIFRPRQRLVEQAADYMKNTFVGRAVIGMHVRSMATGDENERNIACAKRKIREANASGLFLATMHRKIREFFCRSARAVACAHLWVASRVPGHHRRAPRFGGARSFAALAHRRAYTRTELNIWLRRPRARWPPRNHLWHIAREHCVFQWYYSDRQVRHHTDERSDLP